MARALLLSALLLAARAAPSSAALSAETVDSVLSKLGETGLFRLASPGGRRSLLDAGNTGDDLSAAQLLGSDPDLSTLASLAPLFSPELLKALTTKTGPPLTVFAPTNEAFAALFAAIPAEVAKNSSAVTALIEYHIVPGVAAKAASLHNGERLFTALGSSVPPLKVELMGGVTVVAVGNSASVVKADLLFNRGRGVAHKINAVLLPVAL